MKLIALMLSLAVLVGCQSSRVAVESSDRYSQLQSSEPLKAQAAVLPQTPKVRIINDAQGEPVAVIDQVGLDQLDAYRAVARQNTEALGLLIDAHNGLVQQRNLMLENLKLEEQRSNFYAEQYAVSENARRDQYNEFQMELLIHKAMMVIMGVALVL